MITKSISTIFCYIFVLHYVYGTNMLNDVDVAYDKCLTWSDNETTLILKCRIPKLSPYVKYYHERSKTNVTCNMVGETLNCNPKDKKIHAFRNGKQIALVLHESKIGKDLSGDWICQTKERKLKATVNLIKGIITDVWVKIRGSVIKGENGKRNLSIECSSCRMPFKKYTEIWFNKTSSNGIWLNETGDCILGHGKLCSPNQCDCSASGNMFRISYRYPELGTNIACSMHFKDIYRNGLYHANANATFNGTDFSFNSTQIFHMIKRPTLITTSGPNGVDAFTVDQTTVNSIIQDEQELPIIYFIFLITVGIVSVGVVTGLIIATYREYICLKKQKTTSNNLKKEMAVSTKRKDRLKKSHGVSDYGVCSPLLEKNMSSEKQEYKFGQSGENRLVIGGDESDENNESSKADVPSDECILKFSSPHLKRSLSDNKETKENADFSECKICRRSEIHSKSTYYCLNCGVSMCLFCVDTHKNICPDMEKHKQLPIDQIPDAFASPSLCESHTGEKISYFCEGHKTVLCRICSDQGHLKCSKITIEERSDANMVKKELKYLKRKIDSIRNRIEKAISEQNPSRFTNESTGSDIFTDDKTSKRSLQESNVTQEKNSIDEKRMATVRSLQDLNMIEEKDSWNKNRKASMRSLQDFKREKDNMKEKLLNKRETFVIQSEKTEFENAQMIDAKIEKNKDSLKRLEMFEQTDKKKCMLLYENGSYIDAFIQIYKLLQKLDQLC